MPWRPLSPDERGDGEPRYPQDWRKTPILIDESLGREVAEWLREKRCNVVFAGDAGLSGRSDEELFAYAWRKRRMLWTHDRDFLDDRRFPEHRNPGIVVLPGGDGDQTAMGVGLAMAVTIFGRGPQVWLHTKSVVSPTGEVQVRRRHFESGRILSTRYRVPRNGRAEVWQDDRR
jgi:predicted nuclease of predicted toxin-antitoxin system